MRVIAGKAKGRKLKSPPRNLPVRPTADRVKEAIFNILAPELADKIFLDLFAGTGSMGIEALSQGASLCWLVENDRACLKIIEENLRLTGLEGLAKIYRGDVRQALRFFKKNNLKFDIIFFDPPYRQDFYDGFLGPENFSQMWDLIKNGGALMVEFSPRINLGSILGPPGKHPVHSWGDNKIVILRK